MPSRPPERRSNISRPRGVDSPGSTPYNSLLSDAGWSSWQLARLITSRSQVRVLSPLSERSPQGGRRVQAKRRCRKVSAFLLAPCGRRRAGAQHQFTRSVVGSALIHPGAYRALVGFSRPVLAPTFRWGDRAPLSTQEPASAGLPDEHLWLLENDPWWAGAAFPVAAAQHVPVRSDHPASMQACATRPSTDSGRAAGKETRARHRVLWSGGRRHARAGRTSAGATGDAGMIWRLIKIGVIGYILRQLLGRPEARRTSSGRRRAARRINNPYFYVER